MLRRKLANFTLYTIPLSSFICSAELYAGEGWIPRQFNYIDDKALVNQILAPFRSTVGYEVDTAAKATVL